ncbi:hypothetical protein J6590_032404 [Homalodisca vitripennis]|nr:hypothetical protein J6590_032404 [Homalodisca vitripennis]
MRQEAGTTIASQPHRTVASHNLPSQKQKSWTKTRRSGPEITEMVCEAGAVCQTIVRLLARLRPPPTRYSGSVRLQYTEYCCTDCTSLQANSTPLQSWPDVLHGFRNSCFIPTM